jgi:uncharacterized membrane protein YvbJ
MFCKNCGVELEDSMQRCPLCGEPGVGNLHSSQSENTSDHHATQSSFVHKMSQPQKKLTWEIVSLTLLSGAIATFTVDFIINKRISWSEYPVAICLVIFCYVSFFAFSNQNIMIKLTAGLILSCVCLLILDFLTAGIRWSIALGIPLLVTSNLVVFIFIAIIRKSKYKGINLIAYGFLGLALICIFIEGVLSHFSSRSIQLHWSIIVASCIIPVVIVLLFVHFRLKKGRSLEKTFHI